MLKQERQFISYILIYCEQPELRYSIYEHVQVLRMDSADMKHVISQIKSARLNFIWKHWEARPNVNIHRHIRPVKTEIIHALWSDQSLLFAWRSLSTKRLPMCDHAAAICRLNWAIHIRTSQSLFLTLSLNGCLYTWTNICHFLKGEKHFNSFLRSGTPRPSENGLL